MSSQRESVKVLQECIDLQIRKSQDYQNPNSNIVQSMHYRRGVSTIHDMIHQKLLRAQSLLEPMENGEQRDPNFESLEDTYKDLINYASFAVSYIRGRMEGQDGDRDMLNRKVIHEGDGQIEDDTLDIALKEIESTSSKNIDKAVADTYIKAVASKGPIVVPEGEEVCNDSVVHTYVDKVKDVGDRIDESFGHDETMKKESER